MEEIEFENIALYISLNYQCIFCAKLFCVFLVCNISPNKTYIICIASYKSLGCQYSWIFKFPLADLPVFSCLWTSVWVSMWVVTDTLHWSMATQFLVFTILFFTEHTSLNPIRGGGVFSTPSNFTAFRDPLKVKNIEMFHADFSYLSIYKQNIQKKSNFFGGVPPLRPLKK